jgi:hypothetical protein
MKPTIVLYTHTDVRDVWPPFFGQTGRWMDGFDKVVFVNKDDESIPQDYRKVFYDDRRVYRERLLMCLEQIDNGFIFFHHEDMFLYGRPDIPRIERYCDRLAETDLSFVKVIRAGDEEGFPDMKYNELKKFDATFGYIFAIQPAIWKREKFIELVRHSGGNTIWEFESAAQDVCRSRGIYGYYVDDGGVKRGRHHWDSVVYPYVATAVVSGRWNTMEYPGELAEIFKTYNIDLTKRKTNG